MECEKDGKKEQKQRDLEKHMKEKARLKQIRCTTSVRNLHILN
jgi:hypothetical protein